MRDVGRFPAPTPVEGANRSGGGYVRAWGASCIDGSVVDQQQEATQRRLKRRMITWYGEVDIWYGEVDAQVAGVQVHPGTHPWPWRCLGSKHGRPGADDPEEPKQAHALLTWALSDPNWRSASQALDDLMRKLLVVHRLLEAEERLANREPPTEPT